MYMYVYGFFAQTSLKNRYTSCNLYKRYCIMYTKPCFEQMPALPALATKADSTGLQISPPQLKNSEILQGHKTNSASDR